MTKAKDLAGQTFGRLTVVSRIVNDKHGNSRWLCRCECGGTAKVVATSLRVGYTKSCGCLYRVAAANKIINITGQRFDRLVVMRRVENWRGRRARWICVCDCGNTTEVCGSKLRSGHTRSCGCLQREVCAEMGSIGSCGNTKHGHARTGIFTGAYRSWTAMKARCTNPKNNRWYRYGGRGISVCGRWQDSFENFFEDMGARPTGYTIDRYPDNNGNYEPGNCRWATPKQQRANQGVVT